MEDNPLKALLDIENPKSKLLEDCRIAAKAIQATAGSLTLKNPEKPVLENYIIAILSSLQNSLALPQQNAVENQTLNESLVYLLSLVINKLPVPIASEYSAQIIDVLEKERCRYGKTSKSITKYSLPILAKLFISR